MSLNMRKDEAIRSRIKEKAQLKKDTKKNSPSSNNGMHILSMLGNQQVQRLFQAGEIMAKLTLSQPGDLSERVADHIADRVVNGSGNISNTIAQNLVNRRASRKTGKNKEHITNGTESRIHGLSGGRPLPEKERSFYESRMGGDFSGVRIHNGRRADELAKAINARAFTFNNNIVFAKGEYSPDTIGGKKLMAHELTHVMQQGEGVQRYYGPPEPISASSFTEWEFEDTGMQLYGVYRTGNINHTNAYEYLIKGSKQSWINLFNRVNVTLGPFNAIMPWYLEYYVMPFIKTALNPAYARRFSKKLFQPEYSNNQNLSPYAWESLIRQESLSISFNDIVNFFDGYFSKHSTPIPWNENGNGDYSNEDKGYFSAFIDKYLTRYIEHISRTRTDSSAYLGYDANDIIENSTPDMLARTYLPLAISFIETSLIAYCHRIKYLDGEALPGEEFMYFENLIVNASKLLNFTYIAYFKQKEDFKNDCDTIGNKIISTATGLIPSLKVPFLDLLIKEASNLALTAIKDSIVNTLVENLFDHEEFNISPEDLKSIIRAFIADTRTSLISSGILDIDDVEKYGNYCRYLFEESK